MESWFGFGSNSNRSNIFRYFIIFCILLGIGARFYGIGTAFLLRDEAINHISAIKMHHNRDYDPRLYDSSHPPIATWFLGLPTLFLKSNYEMTSKVPLFYAYTYMAPYKETYIPLRLISAFFGIISLLLIFVISKEVFGKDAALWSMLIAALSFDMIAYSRILYRESVTIAFFLATLYFYLLYIKNQDKTKRSIFGLFTIIFLILTLGCRTFMQWFIFPALMLSQFILNSEKHKENIVFLLLLFATLFLTFFVIWPPAIRSFSQAYLNLGAIKIPTSIFALSFPQLIKTTFLRNSYLFLFALVIFVLDVLLYFRGVITHNESNVSRNYITILNPFQTVITITLILGFFYFGFTIFVHPRYIVYFFLPLFIYLGKTLEIATERKMIKSIVLFLIIINIIGFFKWFPNYAEYTNFGLKGYEANSYEGPYHHISESKKTLEFLKDMGNPPIMTNEHNLLTFYEGISYPLIASYEVERCNEDTFSSLPEDTCIVYWRGYTGRDVDIKNDKFTCSIVRNSDLTLIRTIGDYPLKQNKMGIYKVET